MPTHLQPGDRSDVSATMSIQKSSRRALQQVNLLLRATLRRYLALPLYGKSIICMLALVPFALLAFVFIVGPDTIAQTLYDLAQKLAELRFGWLILTGFILLTSFPPLIGFTTTATLCGFAYGWKAIAFVGPASLVGSAIVFIVLRLLFRKRVRLWTSENEKWKALESVIKSKGLPLIILIRISPFPPWVYNNALFASIETVALWQFVVATVFVVPKLFLAVFIGSRIAIFADHDHRGEMDTTAKILNISSVALSIVLAIISAIVLYRLMQKEIRKLRESPEEVDELAAEALEEAENAPLLHNFSAESVVLSDRSNAASPHLV